MANVFFSYSHQDEELRNRLETHLALLKRQGLVEAWHDRRILAGSEIDQEISSSIEAADVILLLVSADFIASEYCYSREVHRAMERHESGSAVVVPVILKACDWHGAPFGKLLATPKDGRAVTSWPNHDEAFADIATHIRRLVENLQSPRRGSPARSKPANPSLRPIASSAPTTTVRSSNLRLKKEFTERDRDAFLHKSFDFIAEFFQGSLNELEQRHQGIETTFRRIDADTFTAVVYRDGKNESECSIRLGGLFGQGISFSYDANTRGNSANENLSVEADDQALFFRTLGFGQDQARLSAEAAAEHLWSMLIRSLQ